MNTPQFPFYFRKDGRCIKVISETEAFTILIPPDSLVPERFTSTYPDKERLKEDLLDFKRVDEAKFKEFMATFYLAVNEERQKTNLNEHPELNNSPYKKPEA